MKSIIFLDYDGVVNTVYFRKYKEGYGFRFAYPDDGFVNNEQAIQWLNETYRKCPYDIVVSSTWRKKPNYKECLYNAGLNPEIQILGATPILHKKRHIEIETWLQENSFQGKFVILDDEKIGGKMREYWIRCDMNHGYGIVEMYQVLERIKPKEYEKAEAKQKCLRIK